MAKNAQYGKKKIIQLSAVALTLLIIAAAAYWYFTIYSPKQGETKPPYVALSVAEVPLKAAEYATNNGINGGLAYYDVQIAHHTNIVEQRQLLVYKANFATQAKRYDSALQALSRADQVSSDASVMAGMAQVYEAEGDKQAAISKYKEAIAKAGADTDNFSNRYAYRWQFKVEELSR